MFVVGHKEVHSLYNIFSSSLLRTSKFRNRGVGLRDTFGHKLTHSKPKPTPPVLLPSPYCRFRALGFRVLGFLSLGFYGLGPQGLGREASIAQRFFTFYGELCQSGPSEASVLA